MESRFRLKALTLVFAAVLCHNFALTNSELASVRCEKNETCGYNSLCINKECVCNEGFTSIVQPVGKKGKDCIDKKCQNGKCYTCIDDTRCKRCVSAVTQGKGTCIDKSKCETEVILVISGEYEGDVCKAQPEEWTKGQIIGLIVGLCLVAILIIVIGIIIFIIRKRKMDEDTKRQIEEIRARKKKEKRERRKARNAAKNGKTPEENQGAVPADAGKESSGNVLGARDFEV